MSGPKRTHSECQAHHKEGERAMGWYQKGVDDESLNKAKKESKRQPSRLWIPPTESKKIVMLDDEPFCIWEHQLKISGSWKNWFTCRKGADPKDPVCPLCVSKSNRYYVGFVTVLDVGGWENDRGEKIVNTRQLYPMRMKALEKFKIIKQRRTSLVGAMFEITRSNKDAETTGDMFEFIKEVDPFKDEEFWHMSRLEGKKKPPEVFDYMELLKPMSTAEMKAIGFGGGGGGSYDEEGDEDEGGGDEDTLY